MSNQNIAFVNLKEMIESQKQQIVDVEHKNMEKADCMRELNELIKTATKIVRKETMLDKECQKELKQMKVLNSKMSRDIEYMKKENELMTKELKESKALTDMQQKKSALKNGVIIRELEERKALNDMQQKKFAEEIRKNVMQIGSLQVALKKKNDNIVDNNVSVLAEQLKVQNEQLSAKVIQLEKQLENNQKLELENQQLKGELDVMKHMEDEFLNMVSALHMDVMEKERLLRDSEDFNQSLITKERDSNDELQKARKKLIEGIAETSSLDGNIVVKKMGEIDTEPFVKALTGKRRCNKEEAEQTALEICSSWQQDLENPHWYPFKIITIGGKAKEIINDEDEKLKRLKKNMGVGAYKAVVAALKEMNEYNPSGRFMIRELWNNEEGKRATLEEGIDFLLNQTNSKRRKIHRMGDEASENIIEDEVTSVRKGV